MTDDERRTRQPLSMTRRYRRGLILTGLLCALAVLTAATVLFQRSYAERIDNYLMQICHGYAAAYEAQDTHSATTLLNLLPENCPLRITLIDTDGTVLYDTKRGSYIVDVNGDIYAAQTDLPNHADRPEFQQAMASGSACITRESETLQLETHYYAVRIDLPEGAQVLRVGEDVANIWGLSTDTLPLLCGAVVLILLAATLFSWWLTRRMVQPINHLAEHLDTIEADVPYEELIPLARTIQTDRKLREDNETMRREFTANVSHELKTPLTSISGYAELIETGMAKPADVPTFAARIHKEAQRMIALVSDILQLSELDSTQASRSREPVTEMAPVDLAALVKETAQNMTVNARRAYVTLQYDARPAAVLGLALDDWIDAHFYNSVVVAVMLIVYGIAFILIERRPRVPTTTKLSRITYRQALIVGAWQVLALIPGTSRSGSTIIGGLLCGMSRACASQFTFFLAIPVMAGASGLKLVKFLAGGGVFTVGEIGALLVGCIVAFVVSILAIRFLMDYVKKHTFTAFGWYRIALGIVVLGVWALQTFVLA